MTRRDPFDRHEPHDLPTHGVVEDFFARERADIDELPGHDLHWQGIVREGRRGRGPRAAAWLATAAAAVLVAGAGVAVWQGQQTEGDLAPAGQSSSTVPVPSPEDTSATTSATTPSSDAFHVRSMTSGDAQTRGALGTGSCEGAPCAVIRTTSDDGATWTTASALTGVAPAPADGAVPGAATEPDQVGLLRFADPETAWVAGSTIRRTTDGGQTWANYPYPGGTVVAMEVDEGVIRFVTAESCTADGCSGPLRVYRAATGDTLAETQVLEVDLDEITDVDLVTSGGEAFLAVDHGGGHSAYRLADTATEMPVCGDTGGLSLGAPAQGGGVITATCEEPADGGTEVRVVRSTDRGETWSEPTEPTYVQGRVTALAQPQVATLVLVTDATDGSGIYRSTDAGVAWNELVGVDSLRGPWLWAGAGGAGRVYAVRAESGTYVESLDDGSSWREVSLD